MNPKKITLFCKNTGEYHDIPIGTTSGEVAGLLGIKLKFPIVAARINYKVESLYFPIYKPKDIEFIDMSSSSGMRVYVRTLTMVLSMAVRRVFPEQVLRVEHPISKGYYCRLEFLDEPLSLRMIGRIKEEMQKIIEEDHQVHEYEKRLDDTRAIFAASRNKHEKLSLFEALNTPYVRYFQIADFVDYYNGVLLPSTGQLALFDLVPYYKGMLLMVPKRENPASIEDFVMMPKMYEIFQEFVAWNNIMGLENVGEFNMACKRSKSFELIKIAEALHEKKVASIADMIAQKEKPVKMVMISGPSSSGKTTFSKRLAVQLMVCKLRPVSLSLDNYFINRNNTPRDENGEYDFESLHALDLEFLNDQIKVLIEGGEIELPSYNFETGMREFKGNKLKLQPDTILIMEGIHALNPALLPGIDTANLFKIYVSALTTISIDNHNYIPTTDTRLIRRIVRDHKYRNYSARETIARWPSVRKGEEKWIFPYQEEADIMFNSALIFELAVLRKYVEPILAEVPKYCEEYTETNRLLKFLNFFNSIPDREIPPTSLLREFLGGSSFRY